MQRLFTVEEANQLIPKLQRLLQRLIRHRQRLAELDPEIQRARDNSESNGGSVYGALYLYKLARFSECAQEIETTGVIIKDLTIGPCDFPHMREERVVYLCWKLGEKEVAWWHEVESGFSGRQRL